jgi:hypothetical protein
VPYRALSLQLNRQQNLRTPARGLRQPNAHKLNHGGGIKASTSSDMEPSRLASSIAGIDIAKPAAGMVTALALLVSPMTVPAGPAHAAGELASAPGSSSSNSSSINSSGSISVTLLAAVPAVDGSLTTVAAPTNSTQQLEQGVHGGVASFKQHMPQPDSLQLQVSDPQSSTNPGWAPPSPMPHPPASPPQRPSPTPGTPPRPSLPPGPPQLLPRKPPVPDSRSPAPELPAVPDVPPQLLPPCPANPQPPQLLPPCRVPPPIRPIGATVE